jgi:hypothetical protein
MKTLSTLIASAGLALAMAGPAEAQTSATMPEFKNATWFNTPALTLEDLEDHAVMVEVFRTW